MITKFEYGSGKLNADPNDKAGMVAASLRFEFGVSGHKLESDEYETLVNLAAQLKELKDKVVKRIES